MSPDFQRFKLSLLASLLGFFLILGLASNQVPQADAKEWTDSGTAAAVEFSIKDLAGIWVPQDSLENLHKFLEPLISQPVEIVIRTAGDGKSFRLEYASFYQRARPVFDLLAPHPTQQPDEWELQLRVAQKGDHLQWPEKVRIKLDRGFGGRVAGITFTGHELVPLSHHLFVRIPIPWSQYVNRLVFAGTWKNEIGQEFSFNESGTGRGPGGQSFTYNVPFSRIGATRDMIRVTPSNALEPRGDGEYCFIRSEDGLILYRTWPDHVCYDDPSLTLKRE